MLKSRRSSYLISDPRFKKMIDAAPRGSVRGGLAPRNTGAFAVRHTTLG